MKAKCIVFPEPRRADVGEIEVPAPGPGQLRTRTRLTGVSTGTETRVFRGKQERSAFPLIPGYENLGEVVDAGPQTTLNPGQRVFVRSHAYDSGEYATQWGSQVSHSLTSEGSAIPVPDDVSDERAIYAKVAGISLHGVKRARVSAGEWVVVVGLGIIGHLVVQHAAARGAKVVGIDMDDGRLELARAGGAAKTLRAQDGDLVGRVAEVTGGGADVAFDATGRPDTLASTAALLKSRAWDGDITGCGRLVLQGTLEEPVSIPYMTLFRPEIDLIVPRDCDTQDMIDSLSLMATDRLHPEVIPAAKLSFADAAAAYPKLVNRELMRVMFTWSDS